MSSSGAFVVTKEYQRFTEFVDAVRRDRYIGLCYGPPGVGKTLSARHYADWDSVHPYLQRRQRGLERYPGAIAPARLDSSCTVVWTPPVVIPPSQLHQQVLGACTALDEAIQERHRTEWKRQPAFRFPYVELLVVDEADRLKTTALETLRDLYDRTALGLVLIGMPGMQRRLARYPQLYSRVGFAHEFRALATDEVTSVVTNHWRELGLQEPSGEFNDAEAIAAVVRTTGGNFRLIQRLFAQITRILTSTRWRSAPRTWWRPPEGRSSSGRHRWPQGLPAIKRSSFPATYRSNSHVLVCEAQR